jgi:hypothetical protein
MGAKVRALARTGTAQDEKHLHWGRRQDVRLGELVPQLLVYLLAGEGGIKTQAVAALAEGSHYRQRLVLESSDALGDSVGLVVRTAAGLAAFGHACSHGFGRAVEVDEVSDDHLVSQTLLELLPVLTVAGEAVEEVAAVASTGNAAFQEIDDQGGWEEFSLFHVGIDGLGQCSALLAFQPEEFSGGEVFELIVVD